MRQRPTPGINTTGIALFMVLRTIKKPAGHISIFAVMKQSVLIVGAGPAGLMAAATLDTKKFDVTVLEKNNAAGRKFLVAGDGGLNITHSDAPVKFLSAYTPSGFMDRPFNTFNNRDLEEWLHKIGIATFTGTSGRVFPARHIKPIAVLNAILKNVNANGAKILYRHTWMGFTENGDLLFEHDGKQFLKRADICIFALGGASWPVTGSVGDWPEHFRSKGVDVVPFSPSNCAMRIGWPEDFISKTAGKPLKNIAVACKGKTIRGEIVITSIGLEGSGIYPLSPEIRAELEKNGSAEILIDLKPALTAETIVKRLSCKNVRGRTALLKETLNLGGAALLLLKQFTTREEFNDNQLIAGRIKALPLKVNALGPLNDAISSVGGISRGAVDGSFRLKALSGCYAIGEMLDYDAPTGGYLLQSCFSMGYFLADHLNKSELVVN